MSKYHGLREVYFLFILSWLWVQTVLQDSCDWLSFVPPHHQMLLCLLKRGIWNRRVLYQQLSASTQKWHTVAHMALLNPSGKCNPSLEGGLERLANIADVTRTMLRKHPFIAKFRLGTLKDPNSQLEKSFGIGCLISSRGYQCKEKGEIRHSQALMASVSIGAQLYMSPSLIP